MKQKYYESVDLVDRLGNSAMRDRAITFLVGSPLSLPDYKGGHGVPGVSGMIDLIRREFSTTETEFDQILKGGLADQYRTAFEFLHGRRGQDDVNRIVRAAVWQALDLKKWPSRLPVTSPDDVDAATCKALEKEVDTWVLPKAVDSFGNLLVACSDMFGRSVLTTNFDPLIEVSILKHGGNFYRTVLHDDGNLGQTVAEGTHIIHLHGYWQGYDTLHTPQQLVQPRPQLGKSLARVVEESTLVVIGYSGWDDVITRTFMELLMDSESNPEIMWAFHQDDMDIIEKSSERLIDLLSPGIGRGRVSLYRGIDCRSIFNDIYENLKSSYATMSDLTEGSRMTTVVKEISGGGIDPRKVRIQIDIPLPEETSSDSDSPLFVDRWIGRDQELGILESLTEPVAFVTGIGGQGKSALVGQFLKQHAIMSDNRFELWDWRDCREESDRLSTQLLRLIERLSNGAIDASGIEVNDIRSIVSILFHVLQDRETLLVFDNVDQYVDLETFQPIKGLDVLVSEAQARNHRSLFLFTCRPNVQVDESRAVRLPLTGLTKDETERLIGACGIPKKDLYLAEDLHQITNGHPLWINLVAMQAIRLRKGLKSTLDLIKQGEPTLPDTTRTIWDTLNEHQRNVLRTMAELDRPESEDNLFEFIPGITINRVTRALRTLRSFHLIETRTQPEKPPLLGLHPIIREFVKTNFPMKDREKYVGRILNFLDLMIGRYKNLLPQNPAYEILEHWVRKAELQITFGHFEEATSTISEIARPLIDRGYPEEMIRITKRLFYNLDWAEACSSYKEFDTIFKKCLDHMIQLGHDTSENFLKRYEAAIPGKSSQFILLCDLRCYAAWYAGQFESAIQWGEQGNQLREKTAVDTAFSTRHNLALSLRDGGRVPEAIESFLDGESLEVVLTPGERIQGKRAPFYGNIGRCLYFTNRLDDALICYIKSAQLLEEGRDHSDRLNKGYIRFWIAELLVQREELDLAAAVCRASVCMWSDTSPPRSVQAADTLERLVTDHPELRSYVDEVDWRVEGIYTNWLQNQ